MLVTAGCGSPLPATPAPITAGDRATGRLTLEEIRDLAARPEVLRIQTASDPSLDVSVPDIRADLVQQGTGAPPVYAGFAGAGVVVGIVDTGIDLEHDDFLLPGGSRVAYLWDQTVISVNPPSQFGYGREWTQVEIDAGSATEIDDQGHGTHVASTAAGNGAATGNGEPAYQFVGVAPEATIVFVKTDFFTSSIVDAVDYIFQKADDLGMPAVVNLSLGHQFGPHDGTEESDLAVDSLVGPGHLVVAAAGNDQESAIHAETSVAHTQTQSLTFVVQPYTRWPGSGNDYLLIDGYYTDGEVVELTLHTPNGDVVGPVSPGQSVQTSTMDGWVLLENDVTDPATVDRNFYLQIWDQTSINAPAEGTWTLEIENVTSIPTGHSADVDAWLFNHTFGDAHAPYFAQGMTAAKLVSSPATADSAIAVAAYTTRNKWKSVDGNNYMYNPLPTLGDIAAFSSNGPRRDGVIKPDLAAPGAGIGAALSSDYPIADAWILADGRHFINQGTSMASPHVTGLVALMLEAYGPLSCREMLDHLAQTARIDGFTGAVPNEVWGAGKIDALAAISQPTPIIVLALSVVRSPGSIRLSWSVPEEARELRFRIERTQSVDRSGAAGYFANETIPVGEVGLDRTTLR
ncbi:MAG: S8 family serine peptidase [Candidatus Eisenbacteria bacterium]